MNQSTTPTTQKIPVIELKKISFYERMSEETNCFAADLYINGIKVGYAKNEGHGGPTDYDVTDNKHRDLLKEAEAYCLSLPQVECSFKKGLFFPVTLEGVIDDLLTAYLVKKDAEKFQKKIDKLSIDHIVAGVKVDGKVTQYRAWKLKGGTVAEFLSYVKGKFSLKNAIAQIKSNLEGDEQILNSNIPAEILAAELIQPAKTA
jgi:hypothetical protein